jgi:cytochrome b6-f complex iron-sulfur subunit
VSPPRRLVLAGLCASLVAACTRRLGGKATETRDSDGEGETASPDTGDPVDPDPCGDASHSVEGWVEVPLADHPELLEPGGHAQVDVPDQLLRLIVVHGVDGCFSAIWRICTHGACETEWDAEALAAVCPCHGSLFADDGSVLVGPATEPLRAYPVVRRGDSLWIER